MSKSFVDGRGSSFLGTLRGRYWNGRRLFDDARNQIARYGDRVRVDTGKSKLRQLIEIARLRAGRGRLSPEDYYFLQLYDDRKYDWSEKNRFVGYSFEKALRRRLKMEGWYVVANDKVIQALLLEKQGVATPALLAIYHPLRQVHDLPTLRRPQDVEAFLLGQGRNELALKPIYGAHGKSVHLIESVDREARSVRLTTGEYLSIVELLGRLQDPWREGFLIQELLRPHAEISAVSGGQLCCARIVVLVDNEGARPWRCVWRVPAANSMVDNYRSNEGNLTAPVDAVSGTVGRVIAGNGPETRIVTDHPRTGLRLEGFRLPDWDRAVQMCLRAARLFPSLYVQSWDIALTTQGPMMLEVNPVGGALPNQLAFQKAFLQPDMEAFLRKVGGL